MIEILSTVVSSDPLAKAGVVPIVSASRQELCDDLSALENG